MPTLRIQLLGVPSVTLDGRHLAAARSGRCLELLAMLVLRNGLVDRREVAALFWPDATVSQGRTCLRRVLADLRRGLEAEGVRLHCPTARVIAFDSSDVEIDLAEFDRDIGSAERAPLARGTGIYAGELLAGHDARWIAKERELRARRLLDGIERLVRCELADGDLPRAIEHLERLVSLDPLRESAVLALMQAQGADGRVADAQRSYRRYRVALACAVGLTPSEGATEAYEVVRTALKAGGLRAESDPSYTPTPPPPSDFAPTPLPALFRPPVPHLDGTWTHALTSADR